MSETGRLRVGVLGLGMAGGVMTSVIATHPRLELSAAADLQPHLRERFARDHERPALSDVDALFARSDVDAVYIATPHLHHAKHAILAAKAGKHIVVEKPMATSLRDCDAMIEAAREHSVALIVGHTHGFDPAVSLLRMLVQNGELGRPVFVNAFNYTNFLYRPRRPDELDPAQGGGVLWNQIPHQLDIFRQIMGKPALSVRAMSAAIDPTRRVDGCCAGFVSFEGGAAGSFFYSGYDRFDSDEWFGWIGASGTPKTPAHGAAQRALAGLSDGEELRERQSRWSYGGEGLGTAKFVAQPHFGQLILTCEQGDARTCPAGLMVYDRNGAREIALPLTGSRPSHVAVWDELLGAVFEGRAPVHDGHFARGTVELCLAIEESASNGREVQLGGHV